MSKYDEIINYNYVMKHPRMSINERSFEFAPFSALVGFNDLIRERERETSKRIDLTDEEKEVINNKINFLNTKISLHPKLEIIYFIKDKTKEGGSYQKVSDYIKKIDFYHKLIFLENKGKINIENIIDINSFDIDLSEFLS